MTEATQRSGSDIERLFWGSPFACETEKCSEKSGCFRTCGNLDMYLQNFIKFTWVSYGVMGGDQLSEEAFSLFGAPL